MYGEIINAWILFVKETSKKNASWRMYVWIEG
jgi:hypothetical protein